MILNSPYISGSLTVTGNITAQGGINISGSIASASYAISASEASTLQGLGSASFAPASTFNTVSQSYAASSASLSTRVTTNETNISTLTSASASFAVVSSSYAAASGSLSTRVTNVETTASVLTSASSSFATMSGSLSTRVTNLEATSSTVSQSFASTSGSISGRVTLIEGQYATTGSNNFTGPQFVNQASNAISFTSTASLYTDGGLRVAKDSFVSGTAYFNNVVVYGTSSIQYITSSQVNFGTNIITVNTDTPAVRFGGLAVFDSGSTQLTGSMLWDSEKNNWIYSNPSGSTYNSAMLMNGPRNTGSLGTEQGTTACALMMGQGGDHITSSMIYSYGNATCFYGQSFISSSGAACFAGSITGSSATFSGNLILNTGSTNGLILQNSAGGESPNVTFLTPVNKYNIDANAIGTLRFFTENTDGSGGVVRVSLDCAGAATFASTITGTTIYGSTAVCSPVGKFTSCVDACAGYFSGVLQVRNTSSTPSIWSGQYGGAISILGDNATSNRYIDLSIVDSTGALATQGMRIISSGNVGIGTICPSTALEVSSADLNNIFVTNPTTTGTTTGSGIGFKAYNGTSVAQAAGIILTSNTWSFGTYSANQLSIGSDGTGGLALRTACSAPIAFFTGCTTAGLSAERMRISSGGKVYIGTSAFCWTDTTFKTLQVGNGAFNNISNQTQIVNNIYYDDTAYRYLTAGTANRIIMTTEGDTLFEAACSGNPGCAVTLFSRMFICGNSGNVGIGTTSPAVLFQLEPTQTVNLITSLFTRGNSDPNFRAGFANGAGTAVATEHAKVGMWYGTTGNPVTHIGFLRGNSADSIGMTFNVNNTEYVRLNSSGNVGIGTTSPTAKLQINSTSAGAATVAAFLVNESVTANTEVRLAFAANTNNDIATNRYSYISAINTSSSNGQALLFATNETGNAAAERMRITAPGEVLVNSTSTGLGFANASKFGSYQQYTTDSNTTTLSTQRTAGMFAVSGGDNSNNQGSYVALAANVQWGASSNPGALFRGYQNTTLSVQINYDGNITNTNNSYGAISDISLKENIVDATPKLNNLLGVKIRNYNLKGDSTKQLGVVAQELEEIFPSMVETNTEGLKSVKYSIFVPMLVKAIQEQQHTICSQAGRIRVLESCLGMI